MERVEEIRLITKHWQCSDKNVYKLMGKKTKILKSSKIIEKN